MLTYDSGIRAEFSTVNTMYLRCSYDIRLEYNGYSTTDMFINKMSFGVKDVNRVAIALVSSFFADYVQNLSLMVNKQ